MVTVILFVLIRVRVQTCVFLDLTSAQPFKASWWLCPSFTYSLWQIHRNASLSLSLFGCYADKRFGCSRFSHNNSHREQQLKKRNKSLHLLLCPAANCISASQRAAAYNKNILKKKKKSAKRANPIKLQLESESKTLSRFYANTEVIVLQEAALDLLTLALPQFLPQQRGDQRKLGARGQALLTTTTQE